MSKKYNTVKTETQINLAQAAAWRAAIAATNGNVYTRASEQKIEFVCGIGTRQLSGDQTYSISKVKVREAGFEDIMNIVGPSDADLKAEEAMGN